MSESLAGRGAVVDVWPFSQGEFDGSFESFIDIAFDDPASLKAVPPSAVDRVDYFAQLCRGGFPEPALMKTAQL